MDILWFRKAAGLTQQALEERSGISRENISRYENKKRCPSVKIAALLAKALNVTVDELVNGPTQGHSNSRPP